MLNSAIELIVNPKILSPQLISSAAIRNVHEDKTIQMRELIDFFFLAFIKIKNENKQAIAY